MINEYSENLKYFSMTIPRMNQTDILIFPNKLQYSILFDNDPCIKQINSLPYNEP